MIQKILNFGRLGAVRNAIAPKSNILMMTRRNKIVAVPPMEKVSKGEMLFLQLSLVAGMMIIPVWVILDIKSYRSQMMA